VTFGLVDSEATGAVWSMEVEMGDVALLAELVEDGTGTLLEQGHITSAESREEIGVTRDACQGGGQFAHFQVEVLLE